MALRLAVLKNVFDSYHTRAYPLIFLFIILVYFILKEKKEQRSLLIYEFFGILLLITPFIGNKIVTIGAGEESNWPVYGILCIIPITAYVAVDLFYERKEKKERKRDLILFFMVVQLGLGLAVTTEQFTFPGNLQKTSQLMREIDRILEDDIEWHVMLPEQIAGELREQNQSIQICYNSNYTDLQRDLYLLQKKAVEDGSNCVILEKEYNNENVMLAYGFEKLADVQDYTIYTKNIPREKEEDNL